MGVFLCLLGVLCLFAVPVLLIVFAISRKKKKDTKKVGRATAICAILVLPLIIAGAIVNSVENPSTDEEPTANTEETEAVEEKTMLEQFVEIGLTEEEATEVQEIFTTVGITKISNIQEAVGTGIDNLQSFKCDIYDYHADKGGISIHFTVDKRQLCFISLDGIPTKEVDYAYINIFGNVKFKTSNGKRSVTLYDVWDENGEIIPDAVGYKAVFNYENKTITNYEE